MIKKLKNIVGTDRVLGEAEVLERYSRDQSLALPKKPSAVLPRLSSP